MPDRSGIGVHAVTDTGAPRSGHRPTPLGWLLTGGGLLAAGVMTELSSWPVSARRPTARPVQDLAHKLLRTGVLRGVINEYQYVA
jgi:hypothetical protein